MPIYRTLQRSLLRLATDSADGMTTTVCQPDETIGTDRPLAPVRLGQKRRVGNDGTKAAQFVEVDDPGFTKTARHVDVHAQDLAADE